MWSALSLKVPSFSFRRASVFSSFGMFVVWRSLCVKYPRSAPWKLLVPRLVTKLRPMPPVATLRSAPPVVTLISSKAS